MGEDLDPRQGAPDLFTSKTRQDRPSVSSCLQLTVNDLASQARQVNSLTLQDRACKRVLSCLNKQDM